MDEQQRIVERFSEHRGHLLAVAYRMLGSRSDAEDAVQDAWLRVGRADTGDVEDLRAWLTTIVGRVCLNMLRSRATRREEPLEQRLPEPVLAQSDGSDPEHEAVVADVLGLALLVVLETMSPAERLAFVLHDMFAVPFEEIAPIVGRSEPAARQLASRARRRVRSASPPDADVPRQRLVADAFLAAARGGDFDALLEVLHPDVVLGADGGPDHPERSTVLHGAESVARGAVAFSQHALDVRPLVVGGAPGFVSFHQGRPLSILILTIRGDKVVEMHVQRDPARLAAIDPAILGL